jgi:hypothetical protein
VRQTCWSEVGGGEVVGGRSTVEEVRVEVYEGDCVLCFEGGGQNAAESEKGQGDGVDAGWVRECWLVRIGRGCADSVCL